VGVNTQQTAGIPQVSKSLVKTKRNVLTDLSVSVDVADEDWSNSVFTRLSAKERTFTNVTFNFCTFDSCYLNHCRFVRCRFVGCRFVGSNLQGSTFSGSKFDYAVFERTNISEDILDTECPGYENLQEKFARSLRVNYQQLGNARAVNKAIEVELRATEVHLYKAWCSPDAYFRQKYHGVSRAREFLRWVEFKALDWLWGNGESALKLVRAVGIILAAIAIGEIGAQPSGVTLASAVDTALRAPEVFLGARPPAGLGTGAAAAVTASRLVMFALFTAILVKRFNRR
jgi:hypothetical protein